MQWAETLFDLSGKTALITGSSRGLGRAIADRMAQHGAAVVISSRKSEACEVAADEINRAYPDRRPAIAVPANISRREDLERLVAASGDIDILVCNAALNIHVGPTTELTEVVLRKVMEANIMSLYWLAGLVLPGMVARGGGRVIVTSSTAGLLGTPGSLSYGLTKAAGLQMVRDLAVEYGRQGIRVNAIAPGMIRTDMTRASWTSPAALAPYVDRSPVGAIGEPDAIAGVAVFLAAQAGEHLNGQTITVDGGYSIA